MLHNEAAETPAAFWRRALIVVALALAGLAFRYLVFVLSQHGAGFVAYAEAFCVWDCEAYASIITHGYDLEIGLRDQPERANWAFFPLYPLLAGIPVHLAGINPAIAGFVVSNILIVIVAIASRPFFGDGARAYWLFVATLLIGPFSALFSSLYTESLFILLTVLALLALRRGRYMHAAGWTALLSATRVTGVLMVFAILAQVLTDHLRAGRPLRQFPARVLGDVDLLLAFCVAPLGLFAYMAFLHIHVGDALAFAHIQRSWGRAIDSPVAALLGVFRGSWSFTYFDLLRYSWAIAGIIALALTAVLALRGRIAAATFCLLVLVVSLAAGIGSMVRFTAGLVPLGMVAAELLARYRVIAAIGLLLAVGLDAVITVGWFNGSMFVM